MKVLWFSNAILSNGSSKATGTWLHSMSSALMERGIELYNITQNGNYKHVVCKKDESLTQWILPVYKLHDGLPRRDRIEEICTIVKTISPDIVHIWGIESYWGLLFSRGYLNVPVLLEIQGIKETCARVFYGGLPFKERIKTFGVRELIKPSLSLFSLKRDFVKWSRYEREMLSTHKHISTHSDWVRAWITQYTNPECQIHYTQRIVRKEFLEAEVWKKPRHSTDSPVVFTMSSGPDAYKGIHDAIRAMCVLKRDYPHVQLRIAGNFGIDKSYLRKPGYTKYLHRLIKKYELEHNVTFLGSLNANQIIEQIHESDVMLQTSYVESYSLAVSEAMMAGVPLVVSYAGAMPELAQDKSAALFYTPSDYFSCAYSIKKLIESDELSTMLSKKARGIAEKRNVASVLGDLQISIYKEVIQNSAVL